MILKTSFQEESGLPLRPLEAPSEGFIDDLKNRLKAETGKEIIVSHEENPELVGGFLLRVGNVLLDASLKVQLEHMKEKIVEGVG